MQHADSVDHLIAALDLLALGEMVPFQLDEASVVVLTIHWISCLIWSTRHSGGHVEVNRKTYDHPSDPIAGRSPKTDGPCMRGLRGKR